MNWNWDHLRYFLALADAGSLSLAATELGVSHTTVMRRVRSLESELETHLFDHTNQGHTLTPAGEQLHYEVKKMSLNVDNISRQVSGVDQRIEGPVVITTTDTLGFFIMPGLIRELASTYPELSIRLRVSNSLSDISNRDADIALRTGLEPPPQLVGRRIATMDFSVCASRDYVATHKLKKFPVNNSEHQFIVYDKDIAGTALGDWLNAKVSDGAGKVTANAPLTAYHLCCAGVGIAALPTYLIESNDDLVRLPANESIASNGVWLLSHVDLRDTVRIRLVKQFILEYFERNCTPNIGLRCEVLQ